MTELYDKLAHTGLRDRLGHTIDPVTKRPTMLFYIEVKPGDGRHMQAELRMSVKLAASLGKQNVLSGHGSTKSRPDER